jgi:hypothetical protein
MATPKSPAKSGTDWLAVERKSRSDAHAQEVKDLKHQIDQFREAYAEIEKRLDVALALEAAPKKPAPITAKAKGSDANEACAFAIASDWHAEETVDRRTVSGLNHYDLRIADERIKAFFQSVLRLTEIERNGTKVDTLVLGLLGDLMTGYIHEELEENNGLSPTQTVLWLIDRVTGGIELLKREGGFRRIVIPCCMGNHGRTTRKPRHATAYKNSYEWMLYRILEKTVTGVEWQIADGYHVYLDVFGRTIRLHHGDNIAYQGGVGGITISVEKAIANWNKARVADLDIFGHHHTQQQNPKWVANGSLIGYGPYSLAIKAPFEPPQQTFFLLDSKRGRTGTWPIFLD